jgi:hypothetical protein
VTLDTAAGIPRGRVDMEARIRLRDGALAIVGLAKDAGARLHALGYDS